MIANLGIMPAEFMGEGEERVIRYLFFTANEAKIMHTS